MWKELIIVGFRKRELGVMVPGAYCTICGDRRRRESETQIEQQKRSNAHTHTLCSTGYSILLFLTRFLLGVTRGHTKQHATEKDRELLFKSHFSPVFAHFQKY